MLLLLPTSQTAPPLQSMQENINKALIDSGAALYHCSGTQPTGKLRIVIKHPYSPPQPNLNTTDCSPMMALGSTTLHLWIAEFKFTHNFIICDQLPETELIFWH